MPYVAARLTDDPHLWLTTLQDELVPLGWEAGHLSPREVLDFLGSLPSLWSDSGPDGRQALATALFARTDVQGFEQMEYELTREAIELGLGSALPAVFEVGKVRKTGRGERI